MCFKKSNNYKGNLSTDLPNILTNNFTHTYFALKVLNTKKNINECGILTEQMLNWNVINKLLR